MADILGAARIVIRAIDGGVKRDLDRIMSQSTAQARKQGESMGDAFSRGFAKNANANIFNRISDGLNSIRPNAARAADAFSSFVRRANVANAAIGGVLGSISALVGGAGALAGAIGGAGASFAVILPGIFTMISAMTVGRMAFKGMGEAIQSITENGVNPFRGISESRADFADFAASTRDEMQSLRDAAADSFLPPLQRALEQFFATALPTVRTGIAAVGAGMGAAAEALMSVVTRADNLADLGTAFAISGRLLASAGQAIGSAWDAMLSIIVAAGPITEQYMNFVRDRLGAFASYLNVEQASGRLTDFFNTSGAMMAQFGRIFDNVFAGLGAIIMANFGPGTGGGYLLLWLEHATDKFANLEGTAGGAGALRDYFRDTAVNTQKVLSSIGALITELLRLGDMPQIGEAFDILATGAPALARMVEAGIEVMPVVSEIIVALFEVGAALSDTGWDMAFFTTIRDIAQSLSDFFRSEFVQSIMSVTGPLLGQVSAWSLLGSALATAFTVGVGFAANFVGSLGTVLTVGQRVLAALGLMPAALGAVTAGESILANAAGIKNAMMAAQQRALTGAAGGMAALTIGANTATVAESRLAVAAGVAAAAIRSTVSASMAFLKTPFGIIAVALGALVGAFIVLYNTSDAFREQIDIVWASITSAFEGAGGSIGATIGGIGDAIAPLIPQIAGFFGTLISTVMPILSQIFSTLSGVFQQILPVLGSVFQSLAGVFGSLVSAIGPVIASLVSGLLPVFQSILSVIGPIVSVFASAIIPIFNQLAAVIGPVVEQLGGILLSTLQELAPAFQPIMDAVQNSLIPAFQNLITALAPIIPMLITSLLPAFLTLAQTVMSIVPTLVGALIPAFSQIISTVIPLVASLAEMLIPAFVQIVGLIGPLAATLVGALVPAFMAIVNGVLPVVELLVNALVPVITTVINAIVPLVSMIIGSLVPVFALILGAIVPVIAQLIENLVPVIQVVVGVLALLIQGIVPVVEILANVLVFAIQVVVNIIVFLIEAISGLINWFAQMAQYAQIGASVISTALGTAMQFISDAINNALNFITTIWTAIWSGIVSYITTVWNNIRTFVQVGILFVQTIITNVVNSIRSTWTSIWNAIATVISTVWTNIRNGVSTAINGVRTVITTVINAIRSVWSSVWNSIASTFRNIWNGITGAIQGIGGTIQTAFNNVVSIIRGAINGVIGLANSAIRALNGVSVAIPAWVPGIGGQSFGVNIPTIPMLAKGGTVRARYGGTMAMIAEAGRDERVEPLDERGLSNRDYAIIDALAGGRGARTEITVVATPDMNKTELAEEIARILEWENRP